MRTWIVSLAVSVAIIVGLTWATFAHRHAHIVASGPTPGTVEHGHVAEQKYAGAQIYRPRGAPTPTRAPGWAAHFADQRTGDLVLTWVDGAQETVVAGGARPCDIGCVATYSTAVALATEATKGVDAGPDPDVGGRQWIDELAACIHRCEQSCDVTWSRP